MNLLSRLAQLRAVVADRVGSGNPSGRSPCSRAFDVAEDGKWIAQRRHTIFENDPSSMTTVRTLSSAL